MDDTDTCLLRPAEVAEMLGVSRSWLYEAAKSGRIPCVRLGGADGPIRFQHHELEAWITAGRVVEPRVADQAGERPANADGAHRRTARRAQVNRDLAQLRLIPPAEV